MSPSIILCAVNDEGIPIIVIALFACSLYACVPLLLEDLWLLYLGQITIIKEGIYIIFLTHLACSLCACLPPLTGDLRLMHDGQMIIINEELPVLF